MSTPNGLKQNANRIDVPHANSMARYLAMGIALLLPLKLPTLATLSFGHLLALFSLPMIVQSPPIRRILGRTSSWMLVLICCGIVIGQYARLYDRGRLYNLHLSIFSVTTLFALATGVIFAIWSINTIGIRMFLILWGLAETAAVTANMSQYSENLWKFGYHLPITCVLLALSLNSRVRTSISLMLLIVISLVFDSRSWACILIIGLVIHTFPRKNPEQAARLFFALVITTYISYMCLLSGLAGVKVKERTQAQIATSGNILYGARPELPAALASFRGRWLGFGLGTTPSTTDLNTALGAMRLPSQALKNTTVNSYFNSGFYSFHSTLWDTWAPFGPLALISILALAFVVLRQLLTTPISKSASLVAICAATATWDLLFSPELLSALVVPLSIALYGHVFKEAILK